MKVYHQLGFRENWNISVFDDYKVGDGFIFSPVNYPQIKLNNLDSKYKKISFFDPQCYFPDQKPKGKLSTYDYFPQNVARKNEVFTQDFDEDENREKIAKECIDIQLKNDFEYLVIPGQNYTGSNLIKMIESNKNKFIKPFLKELKNIKTTKEVLMTLVVSDEDMRYQERRNELLNWATGNNTIAGFYLIFKSERESKQQKIEDILLGELLFIKTLKDNDFKVIVGYSNTESILYTITGLDGITMGGYENLRKFSATRFTENDTMARSPIARLYSSYLMNWIPSGIISSIRSSSLEEYDKLFDKNDERPYNLFNEFNWHFTKPELYKHYFISFWKQIERLPSDLDERVSKINSMIDDALAYYKQSSIPFDMNSNGEHLEAWKNVIKRYCEEIKKD